MAHPTGIVVRILQSEAATIPWSSTSARFLHSRTLSIGERKTGKQRKGKHPCSDKPMILLTHFNDSKLCSQTQPGRGIRKIVDLFHDLSDLLGKADKHAAETNLDPAELEELNTIDFLGLTKEEIDDERKE